MPAFIVLAVYRIDVGGRPTGTRDVRAIHVRARTGRHAIENVVGQAMRTDVNTDGAPLTFPLVDIMQVGCLDDAADGDEVAGCFVERGELFGPRSLRTPTRRELLRNRRKRG